MPNGVTAAQVDSAIFAAYRNADLVDETESTVVKAKVVHNMFDAVAPVRVANTRERKDESKVLLRGEFVLQTVPGLVGPDAYDEQENPLLARAVFEKLWKDLWQFATMQYRGPLQRMIGQNMGNGYVLCRTKVGANRIDALYVTDSLDCIRLDFTRPENQAIDRRLETAEKNREMLITRQPQHARAYLKEYSDTAQASLNANVAALRLVAETAAQSAADADEDE